MQKELSVNPTGTDMLEPTGSNVFVDGVQRRDAEARAGQQQIA
jgi:hypothetical protein